MISTQKRTKLASVGQTRQLDKCKNLLAKTSDKIEIYGPQVKEEIAGKGLTVNEKMRCKYIQHGCNVFINHPLIHSFPEAISFNHCGNVP
jgi:predicted oxidoreductase